MADLDRLYRAMAAEERRHALACLQHHRTLTLPDLAELVLERQADADVASLSPERLRDTYFRLYHTHVPVLEECDLVRYQQSEDLVVATEDAQTALERLQTDLDDLLAVPAENAGERT